MASFRKNSCEFPVASCQSKPPSLLATDNYQPTTAQWLRFVTFSPSGQNRTFLNHESHEVHQATVFTSRYPLSSILLYLNWRCCAKRFTKSATPRIRGAKSKNFPRFFTPQALRRAHTHHRRRFSGTARTAWYLFNPKQPTGFRDDYIRANMNQSRYNP
jgi:hypothetical protein